MRDTALSTHDENGTVTLILNSNDSEGSDESFGLQLEPAPLKNAGVSDENKNCLASPIENSVRPPRRCFEFFRRFSYKRLWGDSRR